MSSPTTYSEWVNLLDKFGDGDDTALEELSMGSFICDAGTASRFYSRVEDAYKKRKQNWLEKFQRSFQLQSFKTEDDFEIALRNGKQNLYPLSKFIVLKGLPEDLRKTLKKDLEDFVAEIKKSLKDNVSKISNGREKTLILLNTFGLNDIHEEIRTDKKNHKQNTNEIIPPTGRKIIF
ncbi:hypothetical protein [Chryseobacterium koreense]|uniref:hypothetical protein n=1 Tax=Chryseobacterium koreense TaxID=232216 RepID=UPI0026EBAB1B|nr:hypothetical protein [Chryseobacterium koreense]